jgi:hypothetical protein
LIPVIFADHTPATSDHGKLQARLVESRFAQPSAAAFFALLVLSAGCTTHLADIVARRGSPPLPSNGRNVALMTSVQARPQDGPLQRVVVAELERNGYHIVTQPEADYTLVCYVEDNWLTQLGPSAWLDLPSSSPSITVLPADRKVVAEKRETHYDPYLTSNYCPKEKVPKQGVRLRFYSSPSLQAGRFETAWEGYIEAGLTLRPEREPLLVKTLLTFFGRDYVGRVKLTV